MKKQLRFFILLWLLYSIAPAIASDVRVVINLSQQQAYLLQDNRVILISPISSGRAGWSTPQGSFHVISRDMNHRSRSFGSVVDAAGRVVNSNATPASRVPAGGHFNCAPMPFYMEFKPSSRDAWRLSSRLPCVSRLRAHARRYGSAVLSPCSNRHAGYCNRQR